MTISGRQLALITAISLLGVACSAQSSDRPFTAHGWISVTIGSGEVDDPASKLCAVTTSNGSISEGSTVTVLTGTEVVGQTHLGAGSFTRDDAFPIGWCKWEFATDIAVEAESYTVRLADGSAKDASRTELVDGTFSFGLTGAS